MPENRQSGSEAGKSSGYSGADAVGVNQIRLCFPNFRAKLPDRAKKRKQIFENQINSPCETRFELPDGFHRNAEPGNFINQVSLRAGRRRRKTIPVEAFQSKQEYIFRPANLTRVTVKENFHLNIPQRSMIRPPMITWFSFLPQLQAASKFFLP